MRSLNEFKLENQLFDLSTDVMTKLMFLTEPSKRDLTELKKLASDWYQLALVKTDPRRD